MSEAQSPIRLAVAEPLLHDVLKRDLIALLRDNRSLSLDMRHLDNSFSPVADDPHVVVWLGQPVNVLPYMQRLGMQMRALGTFEYLPCIGRRYTRARGALRGLADLQTEQEVALVQWQDYATQAFVEPWNQAISRRRSNMVTVHSYSMLWELVRWGAFVGVLPYYAVRLDKDLTALPDMLPQKMEIQAWLAVNPQVQHRADVSAVVEMIVGSFGEREELFMSK